MRLSGSEKKYFFEALFYLYSAKILLLLFPFKRIVKFISKKINTTSVPEEEVLRSIKTAMARANRFAFWKNKCIVQSMAARWMLNKRHISSQLSLGVKHDENGKLIAHAWIKVSQFEIIHKNLNYLELKCFK
jgi:hypothetical protein